MVFDNHLILFFFFKWRAIHTQNHLDLVQLFYRPLLNRIVLFLPYYGWNQIYIYFSWYFYVGLPELYIPPIVPITLL